MNKQAVFIVAVVILLLSAASAGYHFLAPGMSFDSVRWQGADTPEEFAQRQGMLRDLEKLISSGQLATRADAMKYLGAPQREEPEKSIWLYDLGGESSSAAPDNRSWLELRFASDEKLIAHRVRQEMAEVPR